MLFGLIGIAALAITPMPCRFPNPRLTGKIRNRYPPKVEGKREYCEVQTSLNSSPCRLFTDPMVAAVICESEGPVIAVALTKGKREVIFGPILPPSEKGPRKATSKLGR